MSPRKGLKIQPRTFLLPRGGKSDNLPMTRHSNKNNISLRKLGNAHSRCVGGRRVGRTLAIKSIFAFGCGVLIIFTLSYLQDSALFAKVSLGNQQYGSQQDVPGQVAKTNSNSLGEEIFSTSSEEELKRHKVCGEEEDVPSIPSKFQKVISTVSIESAIGPSSGCEVDYIRSELEWTKKQRQTICSRTEEVYVWLVDKVNCFGEGYLLMMAYGELIHLLRDKALLHPNGTYIDDDFDTWITPPTLQMILNLEPYLWKNFGWSMRLFYNCEKSVVFAQLIPICGHTYQKIISKVKDAQYPAIELYIFQEVYRNGEGWRLQDNWGGNSFPLSWFAPARSYQNGMMNLQIPAQSEKILDCVYGNWHVFSEGHARSGVECYENGTVRTLAPEER